MLLISISAYLRRLMDLADAVGDVIVPRQTSALAADPR